MSIQITGLESIQSNMQTLSESISPRQMQGKMHTIGNMVLNVIEESFKTEKSPFGNIWIERKTTKAGQSNKILKDKGDLADKWMVHANNNEVEVSNNIASFQATYTAVHCHAL